MKIAFVVQRYGLEVNGGAELHCRWIAEHLSRYHDIEVITTCAKDYSTWKDEYPSGKDSVNGITVWRFQVDFPRGIRKFDSFSQKIFRNYHTIDEELNWMKMQGPYSSKLLSFIKNNMNNYDLFIFFTYMYCTTFFGLHLVKDKAILVPTAHDEPAIYLSIFRSLFEMPRAIIYNTIEEKNFINSKFETGNINSEIIGTGIEMPEKVDGDNFKIKYKVSDFLIYVGRIDESKGCGELFRFFLKYKKEFKSDIKLILLGKPVMKVPKHPDIIPLGFVSEQDKFDGIKACKLLVLPSKYESLSMAIMEAWLCDNAVLVNGNCDVLKGQVIRSNGGLYYTNYEEFKESLNLMLDNSLLRDRMGENGRKFVEENYGWDMVEQKYATFLEELTKGD